MKHHLAHWLDTLGSWCFTLSTKLSPLETEPSTEQIMEAVTQADWRVFSMSDPAAAAVKLVELHHRPVYLAPSWAMLDRQCFVIETGKQTEWQS